jgi:UDP-N-acetylmuramoyl-L-alanyl-D-glutamate--2,6-diaminopimelate ligase
MRLPEPPPWSRELHTVGVTGTNGKTSTTLLCGAALGRAHAPVAIATTVGSYLDREPLEVSRDYHGFLATMDAARARGGRFAAIELTSEALALGFARAWPCRVGVFTNLTRDHLDAHKTAEHYLASKAQLFMALPEGGTAVLNGCDPASELLAEVVPPGVQIRRYGLASRGTAAQPLDVGATEVTLSWDGTRIALTGAEPLAELRIRAIGEIFAENALAALLAALASGVTAGDAAAALAEAEPPAGRFEVVGGPPHVVVDYAHTPDALRRTLAAARRLCPGRLTVVFGAGGDRDREKRPLMGEAAALADRVVLTSDNPRSEDPAAIAAAIRSGLGAHDDVVLELDRERAIVNAVRDAADADVVVLAGKGHERTQEIHGVVRPFADQEVAARALGERGTR